MRNAESIRIPQSGFRNGSASHLAVKVAMRRRRVVKRRMQITLSGGAAQARDQRGEVGRQRRLESQFTIVIGVMERQPVCV